MNINSLAVPLVPRDCGGDNNKRILCDKVSYASGTSTAWLSLKVEFEGGGKESENRDEEQKVLL